MENENVKSEEVKKEEVVTKEGEKAGEKKKTATWVYWLIGCLALIVIVVLVIGGLAWWGINQAGKALKENSNQWEDALKENQDAWKDWEELGNKLDDNADTDSSSTGTEGDIKAQMEKLDKMMNDMSEDDFSEDKLSDSELGM
ncbi:MAG: hypothetical protein ACOZAR_03785 [Patescibacteria group bacterium]